MNLFLAFLLLLQVCAISSKKDFIRCKYSLDKNYGYKCGLEIYNPRGHDNFTKIEGSHMKGYENEDVLFVHHAYSHSGHTANVPSIICKTFPNAKDITFHNIALQRIGDHSFDKCKKLKEILFSHNDLREIHENALIENTEILQIFIPHNKHLLYLPEDLFYNQQKLELLSGLSNAFHDLPKNIFKRQRALLELWLSGNHFKHLRPEWFENLGNLKYLYLYDNPIEELSMNVFKGLSNLVQLIMYNTKLKVIHTSSFGKHPNFKFLNVHDSNIFAIEYSLFDNINPNVEIDTRLTTCADSSPHGIKAIRSQLKKCFNNHHSSLAVCRRHVEILSVFSSNPTLLQRFDFDKATERASLVTNENNQLREENEQLRLENKHLSEMCKSNENKSSIDKEHEDQYPNENIENTSN